MSEILTKICAKIERRLSHINPFVNPNEIKGRVHELRDILAYLRRLESEPLVDDDEEIIEEIIPAEEKEVDLERGIDDYIEGCLGSLNGREIASCARYFYELGKNAR